MKNDSSTTTNYYLGASLIMFLGFIYNVIQQDLFGSGVFLISSTVFLSLGIIKKRATTKDISVS